MNNTISYLRNFAIISIVLHHSIAAFCGWPPGHAIGGSVPWTALMISATSKFLGLGLFTFISGFVLFYQTNKEIPFLKFLHKKTKRILLPCLVLGCVYGLLFGSYMNPDWPSPINGTHLWYLPMLFLCIIVASSHFYLRHPICFIGFCCIVIALLAKMTHFLTLSMFCFYFPVFYAGFWLHKAKFDQVVLKNRILALPLAIGGAILCLTGCKGINKYTMTIYMLIVSVSFYVLFVSIPQLSLKIGKLGTSLARQSFSIYLIHQFCINLLLGHFNFRSLNFYVAWAILFSVAFFVPWGVSELYDYVKRKCFLQYA